ncbi:YdeI/OmpD-associated family protein [Bacillaceae bacterium Marseille-Q3522]|nr:YdeI/OmpD-associated family protein [Bacillaceae bacterium Marseille-Q3522]
MTEKTITEKLNLKKYKSIAIINQPDNGKNYFPDLKNYDTEYVREQYDLIFTFAYDIEELKDTVLQIIAQNRLLSKGYLFIAYPKKGNKLYPTYVHRDEIFPSLHVGEDGYVPNSEIKFARMVSLDEIFTIVGLKEDGKNKGKVSSASSQCVDDYIDYIPQIEAYLADKPPLAKFYKDLTLGYRKDWARFVYSAKQAATRKKRLAEMEVIMEKGFKSKDLYRQSLS